MPRFHCAVYRTLPDGRLMRSTWLQLGGCVLWHRQRAL
jgi:hypothetical protein